MEEGLRYYDRWLGYDRKVPFSQKYIEINEILLALAHEIPTDLWTLDALWWEVLLTSGGESGDLSGIEQKVLFPALAPDVEELQHFGLERYLLEFIVDNWEKIPDFKDWLIFEQDGDQVGIEFNTNSVGRIDILARHKSDPKWLVIELKRGQTSDQTVGQVLRYMGWVSDNLASQNDHIQGIIICGGLDKGLPLALKYALGVELMQYQVDFKLHKPAKN